MSFVPPPYPYERLDEIREVAALHDGGVIDCSIGTPVDAPPSNVVAELAKATGARGYPTSAGSAPLRGSIAGWLQRTFGVAISPDDIGVCVGTKEFVASLSSYLHLRTPERDTVLYPEISYPTYAMGAALAGLRAVAVGVGERGMDVSTISKSDAERALVLWSNAPSNPSGALDDFAAIAAWGRKNDVMVASDECYAEFVWNGKPQSILQHGTGGVLAVHSVSKRSNLAGLRAGFYAGDPEIVAYLKSVRQHAGLMVAAPVQSAVAVAYEDDNHVLEQRERYRARLEILVTALRAVGYEVSMPDGTFYLWITKAGLDGWGIARELAQASGLLVSPGDIYGEAGSDHARIAVVQPDDLIRIAASRIVQNVNPSSL